MAPYRPTIREAVDEDDEGFIGGGGPGLFGLFGADVVIFEAAFECQEAVG